MFLLNVSMTLFLYVETNGGAARGRLTFLLPFPREHLGIQFKRGQRNRLSG
jgi:hypothetical protein